MAYSLHYNKSMWKKADALVITQEQQIIMDAWIRAKKTPQRIVLRSRICLLAAEGVSHNAIAKKLNTSRSTVILWIKRFEEQGLTGISEDATHGLSSRCFDAIKVKSIVEATLHTKPKDATHWSTRTMAKVQGVSHSTIQRIWDAHGLQPHRVKTFKLSRDKRFEEKLTDVVGVYLNPPDKAVVLCVDEKTQVQALDRTQPGLPMKKGRCGTMTHDYKRNGSTCLFAAMNVLEGKVLGSCYPRHRHIEFLKFLRTIDREVPGKFDIHMILDNYGTHGHPKVKLWLEKHPRFKLHFTPTSSSWLNLIERWFGEITRKRIRRGIFRSVPELIDAIEEYIRCNTRTPNLLSGPSGQMKLLTRSPIINKVAHCRVVIETLH